MSFSDDDLKRLKDDVVRKNLPVQFLKSKLEPLLARLEAAEACIKMVVDPERNPNPPTSYKAWLKECGR